MASEWVMYLSVIAIGVLAIAGVTLTFNTINLNTVENTVEVGLTEAIQTVAREIKSVLELGLNTEPLTRVAINRTLSLPTDLSGHEYQITFKVLPGAKNWIIEGVDITDTDSDEVPYETTIPWQSVSLTNEGGTGLPVIKSIDAQHHIDFIRATGSNTFTIYIW